MTLQQDLGTSATLSGYVKMIEIDGRFLNSSLHFCFTPSSYNQFVFDNLTWTPFPIDVTGIEISADQPNRPKMMASNVTREIEPYVIEYNNLANVKVTIRQTLEKYLADGSTPDDTQQLPKQVYYINALTTHSYDYMEFELTQVYDLPGIMLPRCQALKDKIGGPHEFYAPGLSNVRFRN